MEYQGRYSSHLDCDLITKLSILEGPGKTVANPALTLICALALLSSPRVVCLVQSGPSGIRTFRRSRHRRR